MFGEILDRDFEFVVVSGFVVIRCWGFGFDVFSDILSIGCGG